MTPIIRAAGVLTSCPIMGWKPAAQKPTVLIIVATTEVATERTKIIFVLICCLPSHQGYFITPDDYAFLTAKLFFIRRQISGCFLGEFDPEETESYNPVSEIGEFFFSLYLEHIFYGVQASWRWPGDVQTVEEGHGPHHKFPFHFYFPFLLWKRRYLFQERFFTAAGKLSSRSSG